MEYLMDAITWVINFVIYLFGLAINFIVSFLPNSPFSNISTLVSRSGIGDLFGYVGLIIPVKSIVNVTLAWVACVSVYYIYSVALRFIKVVE